MAWSGFPVQGLTHLNDLEDQSRQLYEALVERRAATLAAPVPSVPDVGVIAELPTDTLQRLPWSRWQAAALGMREYFINPQWMPGYALRTDMGTRDYEFYRRTQRGLPEYYPTSKTLEHYDRSAEVLTAAGLDPAGFTRKRPWLVTDADAPDGVHALRGTSRIMRREGGQWVAAPERGHADLRTLRGNAAIGDVIGPWLWNELRQLLLVYEATFTKVPYQGIGGDGEIAAGASTAEVDEDGQPVQFSSPGAARQAALDHAVTTQDYVEVYLNTTYQGLRGEDEIATIQRRTPATIESVSRYPSGDHPAGQVDLYGELYVEPGAETVAPAEVAGAGPALGLGEISLHSQMRALGSETFPVGPTPQTDLSIPYPAVSPLSGSMWHPERTSDPDTSRTARLNAYACVFRWDFDYGA